MTPAEIAQTRRMIRTARRACVNYMMQIRAKERRQEQPSHEALMGLAENDRLIQRLENELANAGVAVEV
jgi:hypothetical protein